MQNLLPILMLMPLVLGLAVLVVPRRWAGVWAFFVTGATFAVSLAVAGAFDWSDAARTQLALTLPWVPTFGLSFGFGVDSISLWLVLLTTLLTPLAVLGSWSAIQERQREFYYWLMVLETAMIGVFVATDLVFFYICFEFTLIPLYFLIGVWGSAQRLRAARVFFLYTFTGSMLTLAAVLYVAWWAAVQSGAWTFNIAELTAAAQQMPRATQLWILAGLLAGFAVKVPLFPVHTWLPLAHTEAPTAGSVILAAVLLKLGTYGLLRFAVPMTAAAVAVAAPYIGVFAVIGILYAALVCWVQKDLKKLIAYSSVSHLGFCVLGMFALGANLIGPTGSVIYMVNHGLSTGALFLCVGMVYERLHTREMRRMQGLGRLMPVWATFVVFFVLASVGLPGLNGFVGEFLTLLGAFTSPGTLGVSYAVAAGFGMIFAAIYLLFMVGKVVWGPVVLPIEGDPPQAALPGDSASGHNKVRDLSLREILTLLPLALACLWLGLYPKPVLDSLQDPLTKLVGPASEAVALLDQPTPPRAEWWTLQPVLEMQP